MRHTLHTAWEKVSYLGVGPDSDHPDKENIVLVNQIVYFLGLTLLVLGGVCAMLGLYLVVWLLTAMIATFMALSVLIYKGWFQTGRVLGIIALGLSIFGQAIYLGYETRVIDFLIISALLPLVLFHPRQVRLIMLCVTLDFLFYILYHVYQPGLQNYGLPIEQQMLVYHLTIPVKFVTILLVMFVILRKTANQQKRHEIRNNKLLEQRNFYNTALDQMPIDIAMLDTELRFTFLNKHSIQDDELREWMIGKTDYEYAERRNLDKSFVLERHRMYLRALETGKVSTMEERAIDKHGKTHVTMRGIAPIRAQGTGQVLGLIGFGLDITERQLAEEKIKAAYHELEKVNAGLKQFAYVTSHDLKTPLRNIATYLQLLKRRNQLDAESAEMVDDAVRSVKHLNQLISDIFLYTTTDFKQDHNETADLNEVIQTVTSDIKAIVHEKAVELMIPGNLPPLKVNRTQAIHVFSNLIGNAIKYNKSERPRVELNFKRNGVKTEFSIRDNGIGIAPEYQEQVFEIFRRLHTQEEFEGTGIGLAICKKIIESYGGHIRVNSQAGAGAEFVFTLPS
ncbi:MAG: ATP-binding protein [Chitinophagales bacterium]